MNWSVQRRGVVQIPGNIASVVSRSRLSVPGGPATISGRDRQLMNAASRMRNGSPPK